MTPSISTIELPERFRVNSHVADGGMASVWAAEDRTLGRMVAIKLLAARFLGDEDAVRRFQREARAAASLSSHPHVVTIFDVGEHEGQPFIVMEYMSGGSLSDVLRNGRRPAREDVLRWLREAAGALDVAHERGIVHRDVKPGNLLLDERRRLGVTDFGIARVAFDTSVTRTGEVMGTAAYLSPEQAAGDSGSPASDRYALAVVAYELLTGERPFTATNFAAQARQHLESRPPPPSQRAPGLVPPSVDAVLLRGLEKDPDARWPTAGDMVAALEEAVAAAPPTERTVPLSRTHATEPMKTARAAPLPPPAPPPRRPAEPLPPRRPLQVPAMPPAVRSGRRWPRWLVPAGIVAAALLAVAVLAALPGGDDKPDRAPPRAERPAPDPAPAQQRTGPSPAAAPQQDGRSASQLNAEGHRLLQAGRPGDAIPLLKSAVDKCGDSMQLDPCGYANYNLAEALAQSGRPAEAIQYYERRLQFPTQHDLVSQRLEQARQQAGQGSTSGEDGAGRGNGKAKGKNKERGEEGDED